MRATGFSLLEIAVALAVIGLIAAAALMAGGSIFGRAGTTSLLASVRDLAAASREFKTRYSYFPGDLPNASTYLKGSEAVSGSCIYAASGNIGNGIVDTTTESDCALEHLVKAGMLRGIDLDPATSRYFIALNNWGTGTRVSLWFDDSANVNAVRVSNLPCEVALDIDRKLGSPTTGNKSFSGGSVRARNAANAPIETCAANDLATLLIRY